MGRVPYENARIIDKELITDPEDETTELRGIKAYVLEVDGRGEWKRNTDYEAIIEDIRISDLNGYGFAFLWPHISIRVMIWRKEREFVLDEISSIHITTFEKNKPPNNTPLNLKHETLIGCPLEVLISHDETIFWMKSKTIKKYLGMWSNRDPVSYTNFKLE